MTPISPEDWGAILGLAVAAVRGAAVGEGAPKIDPGGLSQRLRVPGSCFVTIRVDGELRGCVGRVFSAEPLWKAVVESGGSAAANDRRFEPLGPEDLRGATVEVSVLDEPRRLEVSSPEELMDCLEPSRDGVFLRKDGRSATFLPQVWDVLPDKALFLRELCEKAGLPAEAWRDPGTEIFVYGVEHSAVPAVSGRRSDGVCR